MVTCGTYHKEPHIFSGERKDAFLSCFFALAERFGWNLEAWAVLSNHYHFVAQSPEDPGTLRRMLGLLHETTAKAWNREDGTSGRKVWFNYWDSRITFERSYLARLQYVHENPVHHGLVPRGIDYPWCSAAWFEEQTAAAFVKSVRSFRTDAVKVRDDF